MSSLLYNVLLIKGSSKYTLIFSVSVPGSNEPILNMQVRVYMNQNEVVAQGKVRMKSDLIIAHDNDIDVAARSLKAMSHPLRLKILCTLGDREVSVQDIVEYVGTTQSNISQHLAILSDKGILSSRKDANRVYYKVDDPRTLALISMMREVFCTHS